MDLTFTFGQLESVAQTNGYSHGDHLQFAKDLSQYNRVFIVYPNDIVGYMGGMLIMKETLVSVT